MTLLHEINRSQNNVITPGPSVPSPATGAKTKRWVSGLFELSRQASLIVLAALLYFGVRGITEGSVDDAVRHGLEVLAFEERLGLDIEHWAQELIIDRSWLVTFFNRVYIWGHWPVIAATLVWLHQTRRVDYLILRNSMFISGAIGLVIFTAYPVAPPRLSGIGLIDTVTEHTNSYRILQPPSLVNKYAAVPSLHVGWNFLVGLALHNATRNRAIRAFSSTSPILMFIAVVVTANHYLIDGMIGIVVAYAGLWLAVHINPHLATLNHHVRSRREQHHRTSLTATALQIAPPPSDQPANLTNRAAVQPSPLPGSTPPDRSNRKSR